MVRDIAPDARREPQKAATLVYVVDDDEAVRDSLRWLLEGNRYQVSSFARAEDFLTSYEPARTACLILDVRMPGMSGLELQEQLVARGVNLPILFITGHGDVPMAVATMKKGAVDFIEKPFNEADLHASVERMLAAAEAEGETRRRERERDDLLSRLTARERQVLECIVAGRLNKQIADDLGISIKTVEAHRANIMDKLNAGTVADLLRLALTKG
jgi:FixJ family two-component response regulator